MTTNPLQPLPRKSGGPRHVVVVGPGDAQVQAVAMMLAGRMGYVYADGAEFLTNVEYEKVTKGDSLDAERLLSWAQHLAGWMSAEATSERSTVVASLPLSRAARDVLRTAEGKLIVVELLCANGSRIDEPRGDDEDGVTVADAAPTAMLQVALEGIATF